MSIVIKSEGISKLYRLGIISSNTITQDVNRFFARVRGKQDPYEKLGEENDRSVKGKSQFVWALKDINFEIRQGEITGIIGKNGAGKSTLLKILSRVSRPTSGNVKIKGRVASLLEVGTGFHQDLTGRENIYLNGSILGMTKDEIKRKFDEIVDFSGVERFIDTPVKRYSSGMYVRLAFAVAAHLEPEILIVDEVLAVGDSEFQKKCLGKMQDVSGKEGRTVLFVSHNMGAVKNLCPTSILLEKGKIKNIGTTEDIISEYISINSNGTGPVREFKSDTSQFYFKKISITPEGHNSPSGDVRVGDTFKLNFSYYLKNVLPGLCLSFSIYSNKGTKVVYDSKLIKDLADGDNGHGGEFNTDVKIPGMFLAPGSYYINAAIQIENIQIFDLKENAINFNIAESGSGIQRFLGKDMGLVLADFDWSGKNEKVLAH